MPSKSAEAIARKNAKKRAARAAERVATASPLPLGVSKTDPAYRRRMPPVPTPILRSEKDAFLRQAVMNTSGAAA